MTRRTSARSIAARWSQWRCSALFGRAARCGRAKSVFLRSPLAFALFYALGKYTPAFYLMYEALPGVALYRRPADATFVFCGLLAVIAGYLIHRWLSGTMPPLRRWRVALALAIASVLIAMSIALAWKVGVLTISVAPIAWGVGFCFAATVALGLARHLAPRSAIAAATVLAAFSVADLGFNNAPNESTGLPLGNFDAMRPDTANETVALLKARIKAAAAPDRRDRVELIGIAYHWPNIGLIHDFDHLFGHNPLRMADFARATHAPDTVAAAERRFAPILPSYRSTLEDLFGARFIVLGEPIEKIEPALKPGDLIPIGRTKDAFIYENPRALPRVLLATQWQKADFAGLLDQGRFPDIDPRRTVLLEETPAGAPEAATGGTVRLAHYRNTDIEVEADAPRGGFVVLNDIWHPWWRASVDGMPTKILKANVLFRAVVVPPGKHVVRFTFQPFLGALAELGEYLQSMRR